MEKEQQVEQKSKMPEGGFTLVASMIFGLIVVGLILWFMAVEFVFNGKVDANAIAVALVAVVSLIVGTVLGGVAMTVVQARFAPKPGKDTMTEESALAFSDKVVGSYRTGYNTGYEDAVNDIATAKNTEDIDPED